MKATSKLASHDNDDRGGHMHAKSERKHGEKKRASGLGHTYRDSSSTRAMIRSSFRSTRVRISFVSFSPCCHLASFWRPLLLHACTHATICIISPPLSSRRVRAVHGKLRHRRHFRVSILLLPLRPLLACAGRGRIYVRTQLFLFTVISSLLQVSWARSRAEHATRVRLVNYFRASSTQPTTPPLAS